MNEATRVVIGIHDAVDCSSCMRHALFGVLSPAFVPYHPSTDAGMVACGIDDGFVLAVEVLHAVVEGADGSASTARRHVLPNDQAVAVAPFEPEVVLHLDVLAHHIHAEVLDCLQVEDHGLVGWRCEQSVGPPALVERAIEIERLIVEQDAWMPFGHSARELPHAEVSAHLVGFFPFRVQCDVEVVEVRFVGAPKLGRRYGEGEGVVRWSCLLDDCCVAVLYSQGHGTRSGGVHLDGNGGVVDVGNRLIALYVSRADGFEPYCLPDAAVGCVPDASGRDALLAVGLSAIGGVPYGHLQLLLGILPKERCDVEGEGVGTAVVCSSQLTVHINVATPVHGTKMQQDILAAEGFGEGESPAIHESGFPVGRVALVHDAGEGRLDGERHQYCFREGRGTSFVVVVDGGALEVLPYAIQVHPVLPFHGGTRVFRPNVFLCQLFAPRCHDGSGLLRP